LSKQIDQIIGRADATDCWTNYTVAADIILLADWRQYNSTTDLIPN